MDTLQQQPQQHQLQEHDVQQHELQLQQEQQQPRHQLANQEHHSPAAHTTSSLMDSSSPPPSPSGDSVTSTTISAHRPHTLAKTMVYSAPGSPVTDDTPTLGGAGVAASSTSPGSPAPDTIAPAVANSSNNNTGNMVAMPTDSAATTTTPTTTPTPTHYLPASGGGLLGSTTARLERRIHMARSTIAAASAASGAMRRTLRAFQAYRTTPSTNNMMAVIRNSPSAEINRLMAELEVARRRRVQRQQPQQQQPQQQQQLQQTEQQQRGMPQQRMQQHRQHLLQQLQQHRQQQQQTRQQQQLHYQIQQIQQQEEYMQRQQFVVQQQQPQQEQLPLPPQQQQAQQKPQPRPQPPTAQPTAETTLLQQQQREQQHLRVVRQIRDTLLQRQGGTAAAAASPPHSTAAGNGGASPRTMHVDGIPLPVNILKGRYLLASEVPPAALQQQQARGPASYRHLIDLNSSHLRCTDVFTERSYLCKVVNEPLYKVQRAYFNLLQADDEANRSSLLGHQLIRGVHDIVPQNRQRTFIIISPHTDADALGRGGREDAVFEDLHTYIRNKRRVGETEARALFHQICQTVQVCHRNGIILRDLKLKRFYFIDEERTKLQYESLEGCMILDDPNDDTLSDKIGCPLYTAPELLCPRPTYRGKPADIWSMGVILYTMLVGQYPFYEKVNCNLITIIRHCQVQIPSSLSRPVRWLLLLLLRKKHEERIKADDILHLPWMRKQRAHYMPVPAGLWLGDGDDEVDDGVGEKMDAEDTSEGDRAAASESDGASLEGSQRSEDIIESITMEQCIDREEGENAAAAASAAASASSASVSASSSVDDHNYAIAANEGVGASASSSSSSPVDSSVRPLDYRLVTLEQQLMQLHQQAGSLLGELP